MAESHESISFPKGAVKELLNTAIIKGVIVSVDYNSDKADITTDAYGLQSGVPVFYHCPDSSTVAGGSTSFGENDEVTVLCENAAGVSGIPDMTVIGYWNRKPKPCKTAFAYIYFDKKAIVWDIGRRAYASDITDNGGAPITTWPCDTADLTNWLATQDQISTSVYTVQRSYIDDYVYPDPISPGAVNLYDSSAYLDVPGLPQNRAEYYSDHGERDDGVTKPAVSCPAGCTSGPSPDNSAPAEVYGSVTHYSCETQANHDHFDSFKVMNQLGQIRVYLDKRVHTVFEDSRAFYKNFYCYGCPDGPAVAYYASIVPPYVYSDITTFDVDTPLGIFSRFISDVRNADGWEINMKVGGDGGCNPPPYECSSGEGGRYIVTCGGGKATFAWFGVGQVLYDYYYDPVPGHADPYVVTQAECEDFQMLSVQKDEHRTYEFSDGTDVTWRTAQSSLAAFQIFYMEREHHLRIEDKQFYHYPLAFTGGRFQYDDPPIDEITYSLDCKAGATVFQHSDEDYYSYNESRSTSFETALSDLYDAERVAQNTDPTLLLGIGLNAVLVQDKP